MTKFQKKHKIGHYKVGNVVFMEDFLTWKRKQEKHPKKGHVYSLFMITSIVVISVCYISVLIYVFSKQTNNTTKVKTANKGELYENTSNDFDAYLLRSARRQGKQTNNHTISTKGAR